ncbi:MAG: CBS domain-containing protein [Acidimicrobiales bacterium]|nr:CBS domain-containing protein [Hyphomonadaceae bacterium]RZV41449.1 MAG: CBS domain-containing protein [Acidimicrobiales bacterium]
MNAKEILHKKGTQIYAVNEEAKLREAIKMLNSRNIGVVLVTDNEGQLSGILSERDIIRRSLAQETGFRDENVTKTMTKGVVTVEKTATVDQIMDIMTNSRIRHIPVMEDGQILGLVSIGDVVKHKIAEAEHEAAELREYIATA